VLVVGHLRGVCSHFGLSARSYFGQRQLRLGPLVGLDPHSHSIIETY
jgi:hypothetical protein